MNNEWIVNLTTDEDVSVADWLEREKSCGIIELTTPDRTVVSFTDIDDAMRFRLYFDYMVNIS